MFSSSCIQSCLQSFLINVSSSSTQLLVNLRKGNHKKKKLSHLVSQYKNLLKYNNAIVNNKVYIVIYLLLSVISISNCGGANALVDSSAAGDGLDLDELGEIFKKVAYPTSTTTTKRSIIDNVYVPSMTTVPTPSLTTFRYYEKDSQINDQHQQQIKSHHNKYEFDLERDHALPTSAPNADILKSNNNPTYPNPNRHHNHNHRHQNATPSPQGHSKKSPTFPMHSNNMPSYSPPTRSFFTPPLPREYNNPFADKPTLRGTNSEVGIMDTGNFMNRRPIPPPSITPGHERVPLRPDLSDNRPVSIGTSSQALNTDLQQQQQQQSQQPKKVLNTPSHKVNKVDLGHPYDNSNGNRALLNSDNPSDVSKIIPSISRILSGSNGRKEDIPDVLLRTVTVRPIPAAEPSTNEPSSPDKGQSSNSLPSDSDSDNNSSGSDNGKSDGDDNNDVKDLNQDGEDSVDEDDDEDNYDEEYSSPSQSNSMNNKNINSGNGDMKKDGDPIYSTENIQNLANVNHDRSLFTSTQQPQQNSINQNPIYNINSNSKFNAEQSEVQTWTIAWNIHVYLSAILFTILAVYSIFKMMFYDKLTHLFNQSYFITIHLFLIIICLARIFYLCYDAYNIHLSFDPFVSEVLLNLPATFLTVAFATLILFLLIRSLNHKNNRYSPLMRPLTVLVACSVHVGLCITLHYVESIASQNFNDALSQQAANGFASTKSKVYNNIIRGHSGPPRLLSLICQIIYIFVCLSLGIFYLYIYRILKRVLRNKSQNYIHGYQNLSYAIHITIAIALLFVSLAALQIYGAISVSSTKSLSTYDIDINWPQWGYQFSLRLIEVTIIALLSWVTGLKTGTSDMQLNAINMDNGIIPPHGARSGLDFQLVNPNGGFARGYETNSFRSIGGVGIHNNPTDTIKHYPMNHHHQGPPPPHLINHQPQINNDTDRDYFSNNDNGSTIVPDHYENPNFELRCDNTDANGVGGVQRMHNGSSSESNNQNNLDEYYSEPLNAQQQSHHQQSQMQYDARSRADGGPYDFQNFERPTFDRSSSRNEFRVSKNLKALKSGGVGNSNTLNYNYGDNTSNHSSAYGFTTAGGNNNNNNNINSSNNSNFNNNSFERRSGVRKSGTLNNIGAIHHTRGSGMSGSGNNERTMNGNTSGGGGCNSSSSSSSGIVVGHHRSGIQTLNSRSAQQQQQQLFHQPQYERDFSRNTSGRMSNKAKLMSATAAQHSPTAQQQIHHQQQRSGSSNVMDQYQSSSGDSATSGSMLVAEHGFVRFRELSDIGINEC
ncbi:hypothetical protein PVAND_000666 [Polypedilum vanderplanki]|uniref:Proline-rich transmembrane protein 3/4 domain-containing protein n=1 Tax=Polypedilum vanderplanki TaxID=319348 RepID=A0A9J6BLZ4_POLVA|nr:hypothetical protein PVAND_000666 [Polypedilum vanderplanki]